MFVAVVVIGGGVVVVFVVHVWLAVLAMGVHATRARQVYRAALELSDLFVQPAERHAQTADDGRGVEVVVVALVPN